MTATANTNKEIRIRITKTNKVKAITTIMMDTLTRPITKAAVMDIMMNRTFVHIAICWRFGADNRTEATTMLMPTTHTSTRVGIMRAKNMAGNTKTSITMINTTKEERLLRASTHRAKATQSVEEIPKKIPRPSVISP